MKTTLAIFDAVCYASQPLVWFQNDPGNAGLYFSRVLSSNCQGHTVPHTNTCPVPLTPSWNPLTVPIPHPLPLCQALFWLWWNPALYISPYHLSAMLAPCLMIRPYFWRFSFIFLFSYKNSRLLCKWMTVRGTVFGQVQKLHSMEWTRRGHHQTLSYIPITFAVLCKQWPFYWRWAQYSQNQSGQLDRT